VLVLVILDTVLVVLLTGLVAGLLRSHTEILRVLGSMKGEQPEAPAATSATPARPAIPEDPTSASQTAAQVQIRK